LADTPLPGRSRDRTLGTKARRAAVRLTSLACALIALQACSRPAPHFSEQHAFAHVRMLAGTIGSRPVGTEPNARARQYLVDQLSIFGFDVRIQEADAQRPEYGLTARVQNIIAIRPGASPAAIALVAHYDSAPEAPGAADDGLGVAVSLEAARVLAARPEPRHTLIVLLTDGEEAGLMGAAAAITDPELTSRLRVFLNLEAVGSSGAPFLFEAGPRNHWLVEPWARRTPHPRGSSLGTEIYRHLPNDTDFSILKRTGRPGLNFAAIGDSYAYHTARDVPERLSPRTVREMGQNTVALVEALETLDLERETPDEPRYFAVAGTAGVSYGAWTAGIVLVLSLLFGVLAWLRCAQAALHDAGLRRLLVTGIWTVLGAAVVGAAMVAAAAALRASREVYHPWYAHPVRFYLFLSTAGLLAGWLLVRAGARLPDSLHASSAPPVVWTMALPVWIGLAAGFGLRAPAASHLWDIPLLAAGILLAATPMRSADAIRIASILIAAVAGTLWIPSVVDLLLFIPPLFGRLPLVTPSFVYPALLWFSALMLAPPLLAVLMGEPGSPRFRAPLMTRALVLALAVVTAVAWAAPAYTVERPLRREVQYVHDGASGQEYWEVASNEPGLDLGDDLPAGLVWGPANEPLPVAVPMPRLRQPFVFRAGQAARRPPPGTVDASLTRDETGVHLDIAVYPASNGMAVTFVVPAGTDALRSNPPAGSTDSRFSPGARLRGRLVKSRDIEPLRSSLPGIRVGNAWRATYVAVPETGIVLRASFPESQADDVLRSAVVFTGWRLPDGIGWQGLPPWLPQERAVWRARSHTIVPIATLLGPG
jgi:hypothetical protein